MIVTHCEERDDENVDPLRVHLEVADAETPWHNHKVWRDSIARALCVELRRALKTVQNKDLQKVFETITVQIKVGGKASGAVYLVETGKPAGPEWIDPFFTRPYPHTTQGPGKLVVNDVGRRRYETV